jgi:hypothetical protein
MERGRRERLPDAAILRQMYEYGHLFENKPKLELRHREEHELRTCAISDNVTVLSVPYGGKRGH